MNKLKNFRRGLAVLISCIFLFLCSCESVDTSENESKSEKHVTGTVTVASEESSKEDTESEAASEESEDTEESSAEESESDEESADDAEISYESNDYYDIVDTATLTNSLGDTVIIHKVTAKQDVSLEATLIATSADGSVIGKTSDSITLTEGQSNYFRYFFEGDVSDADIQAQVKTKSSSFGKGDSNAVEMVQYDQSDEDLYVTFKQVSDNLGAFARFKLLFYNGDQIVDAEDGYFSIYAENLDGKDTTDVAEIWVYGIDFDSVEYIFEP
jgi:hypothetical protein